MIDCVALGFERGGQVSGGCPGGVFVFDVDEGIDVGVYSAIDGRMGGWKRTVGIFVEAVGRPC